MRQIELLGAFLSKLVKKIELGDFEEAEHDADEASRKFVGLPLAVLENQPPDGFEAILSMGGQLDFMRALAAATLLKARGDIAFASNDDTLAFRHWCNATTLFIRCHDCPDEKVQHTCIHQLDELLRALQCYEIPNFLHRTLAEHYEKCDDFARAENHLFQSLDEGPPDAITWAHALYTRIAKHSDAELTTGGLSRSEVQEGIVEINHRLSRPHAPVAVAVTEAENQMG